MKPYTLLWTLVLATCVLLAISTSPQAPTSASTRVCPTMRLRGGGFMQSFFPTCFKSPYEEAPEEAHEVETEEVAAAEAAASEAGEPETEMKKCEEFLKRSECKAHAERCTYDTSRGCYTKSA